VPLATVALGIYGELEFRDRSQSDTGERHLSPPQRAPNRAHRAGLSS